MASFRLPRSAAPDRRRSALDHRPPGCETCARRSAVAGITAGWQSRSAVAGVRRAGPASGRPRPPWVPGRSCSRRAPDPSGSASRRACPARPSRSRRGASRSRTGSSRRSACGSRVQPGAGRKKYICGARNSPAKMLPSDSPTVRSMSSGVTTSRCRTRSPKPGKNDSSVRWTVSPRFCRSASQSLLAQVVRRVLDEARHDVLAGRRHVRIDRRSGSRSRGTAGCEYQPYLPSSNARSRYSIDGPMLVNPRKWSSRPASAGYCGSPSSAKLTLADVPWNRNRPMRVDEVGRQLPRVDELEERPARVERGDDDRRVELRPVLERDAARPARPGDAPTRPAPRGGSPPRTPARPATAPG